MRSSIPGLVESTPDDVHEVAEMQEIAESELSPPGALGTGPIVQVWPFQRSTRLRMLPALDEPTATHEFDDVHATSDRLFNVAAFTLGDGWIAQVCPFQASINVR